MKVRKVSVERSDPLVLLWERAAGEGAPQSRHPLDHSGVLAENDVI